MTSLKHVLGAWETLNPAATVYAVRPWSSESDAVAVEEGEQAETFEYVLEVDLIGEVLTNWAALHQGRLPGPTDVVDAVLHYAEFDAYLPADE